MPAGTKRHRFPMLISTLGSVLLIPFGITRERAFVETRDGKLHVRFGPIFDERFPLAEIEEVAPANWPFWAGIGPRANFRGTVGLISSYRNTVVVRFKEPQDVRLFVVPLKCQSLLVSLEEPEELIEMLSMAAEGIHAVKAA